MVLAPSVRFTWWPSVPESASAITVPALFWIAYAALLSFRVGATVSRDTPVATLAV